MTNFATSRTLATLAGLALTLIAVISHAQTQAFGAQQVAAGGSAFGSHTCAITELGGVKCWGHNNVGQLGDGTITQRLTAVDVSGLTSGMAAVTASYSHTCALSSAGGVKCWGANTTGQLGDNTTANRFTAVDVSGLTSGVAAITAGNSHTCALTSVGGVKCWGANSIGQLGDGTFAQRLTAVNVSGLTSGVAAITAGESHTCALTSVGGVKCWGFNGNGQLGDGTVATRLTAVDVSGLPFGVATISAGNVHTCALASGGGVKCWGSNANRQLGDGTTTQRLTAVDVNGLTSGMAAVTAGNSHTCALSSVGGVKCWGFNGGGQLGDGTTTPRLTAVDVSGLTSGVVAITIGHLHTCALTSAGGVKCWGANGNGQLGDGTLTQRFTGVDVSGLTSEVDAITAGYYHTCALTSAGGVKCWGFNGSGQLGDGTTTQRLTAVDVSGLTSGVTAINAGSSHTCALTSAGGVKCWGANGSGQLGDGTIITPRLTAVDVSGLTSGVTAITAGDAHTCALTSVGGVKCWGANDFGRLGDGTNLQRLTAVDVSGLTSGVAAITAGAAHTCALSSAGGVKCWGYNAFGQLGDGSTTPRLTAVDVGGLPFGVAAITADSSHTCALTSAGGVKCWGFNGSGQLGDGTTTQRLTAVDVSGLTSGVTAINAGNAHTCALTSVGGVKCWGLNGGGQLGDGTTTQRLTAVNVSGLASGVAAITADSSHTCALSSVGGVKCWGFNGSGELGDSTITDRLTAIDVFSFAPRPSLASSINPARVNQSITYTVQIFGNTPTGLVVFKADGVPISGCGAVTLASGTAACTTSFASFGPRIITVTYGGDGLNSRSLGALGAGQMVLPVSKIVGDLSGDAKSDLLFQNANGTVSAWLMDGTTVTAAAGLLGADPSWTITHTGDFNGDGKADLLWRNTNGTVVLWLMDGTNVIGSSVLLGPDPSWSVAHVADFNGDGKADLLWRNTNGTVSMWLMNGTTVASTGGMLGPDPSWSISHVADFDGTGTADLLWRNSNGAVTMWLMNGTAATSTAALLGPNPDWTVSHAADFDGNGRADLVWRNSNGAVTMWLMNGTTLVGNALILGANADWRISHTGDFNGDGRADLVWRNNDGSVNIWLMNGTALSSGATILGPSTIWRVSHIGDYNGDGQSDLIWRNTGDGSIVMYLMNGTAVAAGSAWVGASAWRVLP